MRDIYAATRRRTFSDEEAAELRGSIDAVLDESSAMMLVHRAFDLLVNARAYIEQLERRGTSTT